VREVVRVECLAQEHNTMSPTEARIRTARSGDERVNHEAIMPSHVLSQKTIFESIALTPYGVLISNHL